MAMKFAALPAALFLLVSAAPPEQEPTKETRVRHLMDLTGAGNMGKQTMDAMLDQFQKTKSLPPGFVEKFKETVKADDLLNLIIPIYLKYLDEATLEAAIAFYQTEGGKKLIQAQPLILKESMAAGGKWGQEAALKVLKELQKDEDQ